MSGNNPRIPPHSVEAEQSFLGGLLLDNGAWDRVADKLADIDFYRDDHRRIYRQVRIILNHGQQADVVTVAEAIDAAGESEHTGGLAYLGELANNTPSAANIHRYAEIIWERAAQRRLIEIADRLADAAFGAAGKSAKEIASAAEGELLAALDSSTDEPACLAEVFGEALAYIDQRGDVGGLRTGFTDLDGLLGGLEPSQLVIVAARPSVGKSILGINVADFVARQGGVALLCSLEMSRLEVGMRILAARSEVSMSAMRAGTKNSDDWSRMSATVPSAAQHNLFIYDTPAVTVAQVRAKARRLKRKSGALDLVIIDYLGLMTGRGDNRTQEIGSISRGLKALAKELQVPIVALAQLNRGVEGRNDKRPLMSDLRDSGEIEQDADIVVMLHREELYNDALEWRGLVEVLVRKNRNGPTGDLLLAHHPAEMRFVDYRGHHPRRTITESSAQRNTRRGGFG